MTGRRGRAAAADGAGRWWCALAMAVVVATVTAVLGAGPAAFAAPAEPAVPGLELVGSRQLSDRLHELRFRTPAVEGETRVRVLLPAGYDDPAEAGRRYPVLFLLHGGTGSYLDWTTSGDAEAITAGYPLIVVMPDSSPYGGYVDWWNFGAGGPPMWETYHLRQLLPWVDANLRTIGTRDGRAIAGLSMGGGGAMHYAARRPDLFTAAAAFSGAVDANTIPVQLLIETNGIGDGKAPGATFGHRLTDEIRWRGHNPWDLAENLRGLFLQLDTGNGLPGGPGGDLGDPVETAVHQMMTNLHQRLAELGIPHRWNDYGPGGHAWFYWKRDLTELLPRLMARFAEPAPPPSPISYRSIETEYEVWGWHVAIDRTAVEFSRLAGAGPQGFTLTGSGAAVVTTAAVAAPGATVRVDVTDAAGTRTAALAADDQGRLTVPVSLGPPNPYQQLSPEGNLWALTLGGSWPSVTARVRFTPVAAEAVAGASEAGDGTAAAPPAGGGALPASGGGGALPATGGPQPGATGAAALLGVALAARAWGGARTRAR